MNYEVFGKVDKDKLQHNLLSARLRVRVPPGNKVVQRKRHQLDNLQLPQWTAGLHARVPPILKDKVDNSKLLELVLATRTHNNNQSPDWPMDWSLDTLLDKCHKQRTRTTDDPTEGRTSTCTARYLTANLKKRSRSTTDDTKVRCGKRR